MRRVDLPVLVLVAFAASCGSSSRNDTSARRGAAGTSAGTTLQGPGGDSGDAGAGAGADGLGGGRSGGSSAGSSGHPGGAAGESSAGESSAGSDGSEPTLATVLFPPPVSYTDATELSVRGTTPKDFGASAVSVDGVTASSADGFAHWSATVAVPVGERTYNVSVTDELGQTHAGPRFVVRNQGTVLSSIQGMEFDATANALIVADRGLGALLEVDLANQHAAILADEEHGEGESYLPSTGAIAMDAAGQRLLALDWGEDVLLSVDPATGDRTVVSPEGDAATSLKYGRGLCIDASHGMAYAIADSLVIEVDLASGARRLVTDADENNGEEIAKLGDIACDDVTQPASPRLLLSDVESGAILVVDIETGERSVLSGPDVGAGEYFAAPNRMKLDPDGRRLLVVDGAKTAQSGSSNRTNRAALVAVDLDTGARETLSDRDHGTGPLPEAPYGLAFDPATGRAYVAGDWDGIIVEVDLASGNRSSVIDSSVGGGEKFLFPGGFALSTGGSGRGQLFVAGGLRPQVISVDLATGSRTVASGPERGSGSSLLLPGDVALEPSGGTSASALVLDGSGHAVVRVELSSGNRQVLSGPDVGSGPPLGEELGYVSLARLALDDSRGDLFVTDTQGSLYGVKLGNGERTLVSGETRGTGASLVGPSGTVIDQTSSGAERRAIVTSQEKLIGVKLESGDRSDLIASFEGLGTGSIVAGPGGLAQDPTDGTLLVTGYPDTLWRVNLTTKQCSVISGSDYATSELTGSGPSLPSGGALQVDFTRQLAYASADASGALLVVDLVSGERVVASR